MYKSIAEVNIDKKQDDGFLKKITLIRFLQCYLRQKSNKPYIELILTATL